MDRKWSRGNVKVREEELLDWLHPKHLFNLNNNFLKRWKGFHSHIIDKLVTLVLLSKSQD